MKRDQYEKARLLRAQQGLSIRDIALQLQVSKSSVSRWVKDIPLTEEQINRLQLNNPTINNQRSGNVARAQQALLKRQGHQDKGKERVSLESPQYVAGCLLYWAEGRKNKNIVRFSNSDSEMMKMFTGFLRTYFEIEEKELRACCTFYSESPEQSSAIEAFWQETLSLPKANFYPSVINRYPERSYGKRKGKLPYGVCTLSVYRTDIVQEIYGAIQGFGGFDNPQWLG